MELIDILTRGLELNGSDIFVIPGSPATTKVDGKLVPLLPDKLLPKDTEALIRSTYVMANNRSLETLEENGDDDFSFALQHLSRFRCNVYRQRGTLAATYRIVKFGIPDPQAMMIPKAVMDLADYRDGMILITGPAGSGKSTTLACLVDRINNSRSNHIITLEDPIEYIHNHKMSLVSQREIPTDAISFARALHSALRQAPDVIQVGEMRDLETISIAITAAETGHLLLSSLHTIGAAKTIDRIIDAFPSNQQQQVRIQLSMVLRAVVSQRLVPQINGKLIPVFEIMTVNPAVQNMIREGKTHQIDNIIYSGSVGMGGMMCMDNELIQLYKARQITRETAILYASNQDTIQKRLL